MLEGLHRPGAPLVELQDVDEEKIQAPPDWCVRTLRDVSNQSVFITMPECLTGNLNCAFVEVEVLTTETGAKKPINVSK